MQASFWIFSAKFSGNTEALRQSMFRLVPLLKVFILSSEGPRSDGLHSDGLHTESRPSESVPLNTSSVVVSFEYNNSWFIYPVLIHVPSMINPANK